MFGSNTCSTTSRMAGTYTSSWQTIRPEGAVISFMRHVAIFNYYSRRMPFTFLAELQQKFINTAQPSSSSSDTPAYALQGTFGPVIGQLMETYNTNPPTDELARAQSELAQVKDIMVQNVEQILSRGERIELLVDKTDNMASQATAFRRGARTVRRSMWWKNTKILMLSIVVGLVCSSAISLDGNISCRIHFHRYCSGLSLHNSAELD